MRVGVSATGQNGVLRTVIVDDSALARLLLRDALSLISGVRVVGNASKAQAALDVVDAVHPDLVTLDLDMPGADTLELLKQLKLRHPEIAVLVCGRQHGPGAQLFERALALGATGAVETPTSRNRDENLRQLRTTVAEVLTPLIERRRSGHPHTGTTNPPAGNLDVSATSHVAAPDKTPSIHDANANVNASANKLNPTSTKIGLVMIGSSTGGPAALRTLLGGLSPSLPVPVCVVQHIPPGFSKPLAQRLNEHCPLPVHEASDDEVMLAGHVYVAPGGHHLLIKMDAGQPTLHLDDGEVENGCRPAIDVTLRSALNAYGATTLVVILTGMGRDGANGAESIRACGGKVFVQSPDSCTVSSMPRQTIEAAGADAIGELDELSQWINAAVG